MLHSAEYQMTVIVNYNMEGSSVICFKVSSQYSPVTAKERHILQVADNEVLLKVCEPK